MSSLAAEMQIVVKAGDQDKVQILTVTKTGTDARIRVNDKTFITLAEGSKNSI